MRKKRKSTAGNNAQIIESLQSQINQLLQEIGRLQSQTGSNAKGPTGIIARKQEEVETLQARIEILQSDESKASSPVSDRKVRKPAKSKKRKDKAGSDENEDSDDSEQEKSTASDWKRSGGKSVPFSQSTRQTQPETDDESEDDETDSLATIKSKLENACYRGSSRITGRTHFVFQQFELILRAIKKYPEDVLLYKPTSAYRSQPFIIKLFTCLNDDEFSRLLRVIPAGLVSTILTKSTCTVPSRGENNYPEEKLYNLFTAIVYAGGNKMGMPYIQPKTYAFMEYLLENLLINLPRQRAVPPEEVKGVLGVLIQQLTVIRNHSKIKLNRKETFLAALQAFLDNKDSFRWQMPEQLVTALQKLTVPLYSQPEEEETEKETKKKGKTKHPKSPKSPQSPETPAGPPPSTSQPFSFPQGPLVYQEPTWTRGSSSSSSSSSSSMSSLAYSSTSVVATGSSRLSGISAPFTLLPISRPSQLSQFRIEEKSLEIFPAKLSAFLGRRFLDGMTQLTSEISSLKEKKLEDVMPKMAGHLTLISDSLTSLGAKCQFFKLLETICLIFKEEVHSRSRARMDALSLLGKCQDNIESCSDDTVKQILLQVEKVIDFFYTHAGFSEYLQQYKTPDHRQLQPATPLMSPLTQHGEIKRGEREIKLDKELLKLFINYNPNNSSGIYFIAARMHALILEGASPNAKDGLNMQPIHIIAILGSVHLWDQLLATTSCENVSKLEFNEFDHANMTPLLYALKFGHGKIAGFLLATLKFTHVDQLRIPQRTLSAKEIKGITTNFDKVFAQAQQARTIATNYTAAFFPALTDQTGRGQGRGRGLGQPLQPSGLGFNPTRFLAPVPPVPLTGPLPLPLPLAAPLLPPQQLQPGQQPSQVAQTEEEDTSSNLPTSVGGPR